MRIRQLLLKSDGTPSQLVRPEFIDSEDAVEPVAEVLRSQLVSTVQVFYNDGSSSVFTKERA